MIMKTKFILTIHNTKDCVVTCGHLRTNRMYSLHREYVVIYLKLRTKRAIAITLTLNPSILYKLSLNLLECTRLVVPLDLLRPAPLTYRSSVIWGSSQAIYITVTSEIREILYLF